MSEPAQSAAVTCPFGSGMERHLRPIGNTQAVVTKTTSDATFGPDGLGLGRTFWSTIISWLARTGIQKQTGSNKNETDVINCMKGWGQGPFSSRVFSVDDGVDETQLERLIVHLLAIAEELGTPDGLITEKALATFVETQKAKPYSTVTGIKEPKGLRVWLGARFRGHIQWQGFVVLCGQVDRRGVKHVTPDLLRQFFAGEQPFFQLIEDRRRGLADGSIAVGSATGLLANAPAHLDLVKTDREYLKNKSGLWLVIKIVGYMLRHRQTSIGSL